MLDLTVDTPVLHVDLGDEFSAGHAAHIQFQLLCPGYESTPRVRATLSAALDADHWDSSPRPDKEGPGRWSFTQGFLLMRGGNPCPPGRYEIRIDLEFPHAPTDSLGRFLRARLMFRVVDSRGSSERQLEIDLDDLAILDVSAIDISTFGTVKVKQRGKSISSLEGVSFSAAEIPTNHQRRSTEGRCFLLPLMPNHERTAELPIASTVVQKGLARRKLMLAFPDGRRVIVLAQESLKVGRDKFKQNDVLLRWIPVTSSNKPMTEEISAEHFQLKLSPKGMEIEDLGSRNGTTLDGVALVPKRPKFIEASSANAEITVASAFRLLLRTYPTADADQYEIGAPNQLHCEGVGVATVPPLWNRAIRARVEAAHLERLSNLPNEEYVLLFRQALIGPGADCTIRIPANDDIATVARIFHAGDHFWIQRLTDQLTILVDGHILGSRELAPVSVDQSIQLGSTRMAVREPEQDLSREE